MKDFEYYSTVGVPYPDKYKYKQKLVEEINAASMTKKERDEALKLANTRSADWFREASKPYYAAEQALEQEFWRDCREHLGYDKLLNDAGVSEMEKTAWEFGHANCYEDIYGCLCDLMELAKTLVKHAK